MKISVVIPTFNRAYTLTRCIDSVLSQTFKAFEIIVVDDGSTDATEELLLTYGDKLKVFKTINRGVSAARNFAIEKSSGEWIALLDSDDEWLEQRLKEQVKVLEQMPDLKLVHGEELWIRNNKRVKQKRIHKKSGGHIYKDCLGLCLISPSASLIKKEVLIELGGFNEEFPVCEDYDFWLKFTAKYEVGFVEIPIVNKYGGHEDQLSLKFFAMDLWRVRSMINMLDQGLSEENFLATISEIKKKANILIQGYKKHNNLTDLPEVESHLQRAQLAKL